MTFELLEIKPEIIKALKEIGFEKPTSIQKKAIPHVRQGKDVIGSSKTGSGKTAAFGVPILERIIPKAGLQSLIIAPTRELAVQIANEMKKFGKYLSFSIATIYGGVSLEPQMKALRYSEIAVGTPGRLLDHLNRKTMDLSKIKCVVLDEADKLVEMGFIEDIRKIIDRTPRQRQMLLFGATVSGEVERLKKRYMTQPFLVETEKHVSEEYLEQYYYNVMPHEKFSLLVHLLKKEPVERAIIFCSAKTTVDIVARNLNKQGFKCAVLHGNLGQATRLKVIEGFNHGRPYILVASPVAARGLDIKDISHIFNYDLSKDPQEYVHRVGRTARAGQCGKAITLLCQRDHNAFSSIKDRHGMDVKVLPKESFPRIRFEAQGGYGGRRSFGNRIRFGNRRSSFGRSSSGNFGDRRSPLGNRRSPLGNRRSSPGKFGNRRRKSSHRSHRS